MEFQTTETYTSLRVAGVNDDYDDGDECGSDDCHTEQVTVTSVTGVVLRTQHKISTVLHINEGISNIQRAAMCVGHLALPTVFSSVIIGGNICNLVKPAIMN
jgi:hypothetical protein